jgi:hypothetical protein
MPEDMMKMIQVLSLLDENNPDLKDILDADTSGLNDEIENERILKEAVLSLRDFIPTAKRLCKAYFELYQLIEAGEL